MTPLERAQRVIEQWNSHWAKTAASNVLLANIKREIEEVIDECESVAEQAGYETKSSCSDDAIYDITQAIRKVKGS